MTDTANTNELTEQSEKQQATMSLAELDMRDYFAAQAIGPLLQQIEAYPDENWRMGIAIDAYAMADAMLAVRADAQRRLGDITTIRARGAQGESNG